MVQIAKEKRQFDFGDFCLHIGQFFLYLIAGSLLLSTCFFLLGIPVNEGLLPLSFCAAVILLMIFYDKPFDRTFVYEVLTAVLIGLAFTWFCGRIYEMTCDGNAYHKLAIGMLKNGWNPLRELPQDVYFNSIVSSSTYPNAHNLWAEAYCKVTWIFAAGIYAVTGNIESGKIYTMIAMLSAFCITFSFLKKKQKKMLFCVLFSLAAALNPIAVAQMDTYYVDGFLHIMLYLLVLSLVMQDQDDVFNPRVSASLIAASMIICGNIKFTGLLYGGVFCIVYFLWYCAKRYVASGKKLEWKCYFRRMTPFALLAVVTVAWAGSNSYIMNFLRHGNFVYPLAGSQTTDIMGPNSPFQQVNHFRNFFVSLFSKVDNYIYLYQERSPEMKFPFTVDWSYEKANVLLPDARISGFGVLFSGIFILAVIILAVKLIRMKKDEKFWLLSMNLATCLVFTFGITESWWARYAPYVYFIVLMALYVILDSDKKAFKALGAAFSALILVNAGLFALHVQYSWNYSKSIRNTMHQMTGAQTVLVYSQSEEGVFFNLDDMGVRYVSSPEIADEPDLQTLGYRDVVFKIVNE